MGDEERDLRAQLESERALRLEAERVSRLKDEFLATLGHELRTPLNSILGWSRLLESGRLASEESQRGGHTIARNARSLAQLVDDLLDMSGIMSGKIRIDPEETDLCEIVVAAIETTQTSAEAKGVKITHSFNLGECTVFGDPHRLQQVVWNLLNNAVKFTPRGGTINVSLLQAGADWQVRITDTGIGMGPGLLPFVFDRFRQAQPALSHEHSGLGLGLAIVKQLVELHGGKVSATSEGEGHGATFIVTLPRVAPREVEAGHAYFDPDEDELLDLHGVRVLIVDDEADTLELSRQVLGDRHAQVITAPNVDEALQTLTTFSPDVLVSDLSMPGRDGYELIRAVRLTTGPDELPAAALTAFARPEDAVRAHDAGFQMHLAKPVEPDELVRIVAQLAGKAS
jgi:CheY-like chemotaxis protein/nitrogen-specific signal transduction histidine kinase